MRKRFMKPRPYQQVLPILVVAQAQTETTRVQLSGTESLRTELRDWVRREAKDVVDIMLAERRRIPDPTVEFVERRPITPLAIVSRASQLLRQARDAEDLDERLDAIIRLKEVLGQAVAEARRSGPRMYKHGLVTVREAVESTYAEDLTDEQFLALEEALARLQDADLDKEDVLDIADHLLESGLRPIPLLTHAEREAALDSLGL